MRKNTLRSTRQARRVQPIPIPAFAPLERPVALLVGAPELVDAAVVFVVEGVGDDCDVPLLLLLAACVVEGVGDDCGVLLLMLLVAVDALLKLDNAEDGNSRKPGLVAVLIS